MDIRYLTIRLIGLQFLNRILNPDFKTKFIWSLFVFGTGFVGYQRLINIIASFEFISSDYSVRLSLSQETDRIFIFFGMILVLFSIFFFYRIFIEVKNTKVVFQNLKQAALEIRKYLDENRRIFISFGPNSSAISSGEVRMNLTPWESLRLDTICPNNAKIKIILNNIQHREQQEELAIDRMLNHIDAFQIHCDDPTFDYSDKQFPPDFENLIYKYCGELGRNKSRINGYSTWLKTKITEYDISVESIIFFGSALYGEETIDVDCLIKSNANSVDIIKNESGKWRLIKDSFRKEFNRRLHLIVISQIEENMYDDFLSKLTAHEEVKNNG